MIGKMLQKMKIPATTYSGVKNVVRWEQAIIIFMAKR